MPEPYIPDDVNFTDEMEDAIFIDGDDDDSETEEEEEEEEEDEDEDDGEESGGDNFIPVVNSPRVSVNVRDSAEEGRIKRSRVEHGGDGDEKNGGEIEGLFCPICMDAWTNDGDHHICCLPCGHLYGLSCISKWLKQKRASAKCPQCNRRCSLKDVRKLFAPRIAVVDNESQTTIRSLEVKCAFLEKKNADSSRKESEWRKNEAELNQKVKQLTERTSYLEHLLGDLQSRSTISNAAETINSGLCSQVSSCNFVSQGELQVEGASLFDIDAVGQMVLLVRRLPKIGGSHVLTKLSLLPPHESEDIFLPPSMKIIKDLQISPFNRGHALCASLGKKLSVLSLESNNVILSYDLPAAAWSCSWDLNSSNHLYAGLQNGSLLAFDVRQTGSPLESRPGLTRNPIHTLRSIQSTSSSGVRTLLSASSIGISKWSFGHSEERPSLIHETADQGVCISLAYCASSDDIVATFRPKVGLSNEMAPTQTSLSPPATIGQGVLGSVLHLKRDGDKYTKSGIASVKVSDIRLPKSVIINTGDNNRPVFGAEDECGLILQELPSFSFAQRLMPHKRMISDVKYTRNQSRVLLGCLSEDTLKLFSSRIS
ncbi:Transducin/WD40 repeat-like superfamily protein [Euphorbia peplus]|nr:Transducin/WD40 repeat-like superfamily protein [Euphorbia peplus]